MKKLFLFVLISGMLLGITGISFAETLFGPSMGYYRFSDDYIDEDYGRVLNGIVFNFDFSYYSNKIPIGVFSKLSVAGLVSGYEWKDDDKIKSIRDGSFTDICLFIGPSYKIKLGKIAELPVSIGPSFKMSFENSDYFDDRDTYYEAINLGVTGETSLLMYPIDSVYLKLGVGAAYDFFRSERGRMDMSYRQKVITRYSNIDYNAFSMNLYFGVGFRFQ